MAGKQAHAPSRVWTKRQKERTKSTFQPEATSRVKEAVVHEKRRSDERQAQRKDQRAPVEFPWMCREKNKEEEYSSPGS